MEDAKLTQALEKTRQQKKTKNNYTEVLGVFSETENIELLKKVGKEHLFQAKDFMNFAYTVDTETGAVSYQVNPSLPNCDKGRAKASMDSMERHTKVLHRLHQKLKEKGKTPNYTYKKVWVKVP